MYEIVVGAILLFHDNLKKKFLYLGLGYNNIVGDFTVVYTSLCVVDMDHWGRTKGPDLRGVLISEAIIILCSWDNYYSR